MREHTIRWGSSAGIGSAVVEAPAVVQIERHRQPAVATCEHEFAGGVRILAPDLGPKIESI